nr:hypothetical protein [Tanacetum cinerariifolium]
MIADLDEDVEDIDEEEPDEVEKVLKVVKAAKLMTEVVTTAEPTTTIAQVPKASTPRRRRGVIIQDPEETTTSVINNEVMRYQALKRKPLTEARARKNMMIYLKNMAGFKMNFLKGMTNSEIRPLFEKHYNSIQAFLEKGEEEVIVQEEEIKEEGNKRQGESIKQELAKKQRMDEEAEELKTHLQIVANDDNNVYTEATPLASKIVANDDNNVYTEATPLASKVLVVDYQIHHENNKPYYKIIRADGSHKLFLSFITLLKNFDREDLETLWKLVKERFETTEPKNFSDDFLLNILRTMFEKPVIEANQMLNNVRLEVEEESEMSLELLRLVRRQMNKGKWFPTIGYEEEVSTKGTLRKSLLPPRWSVNNWALKPNQPEEPPFTDHMLAICALDKLVVFKAPNTSSRADSVSQGAKPGAKTRHKKPMTSSKQPSVSSKEETKGRSSKAHTGSKTSHSKRRKESSLAMDSNPHRPPVSTLMDTEMHKEDQQANGGPTSLGVTSEERANPQLSSDFTAEADPRLYVLNDSIPPQQGMDEGTKNTSYDHISTGTNPHVLADQTKSVSKGLKNVLTQPTTGKGASFTVIHGDKEEASTYIHDDKEDASSTIKLEDIAKLVSQMQPSFKDLNSPEDDPVIIVDESDEDEPNPKTKDTSVLRSSSHSSRSDKLIDKIAEAKKENLNQQPKSTTSPTTTPINPPIITTTTQMQTPLQSPPRSSSKPEGEHIMKDKGKKVMSLEEAEKESTKSDSDKEAHVSGSMVKSSKEKNLNKFDFVTEDGRHIHLPK